MMHLEDFRSACATRFNSVFGAAQPTVEIMWDNQPFEQPDGEIWVKLCVEDVAGGEAEIGVGEKVERWIGQLRVSVFVPKDTGTRLGNLVKQDAARVFIRQDLGGVNWNARFTRGTRTRTVMDGEWMVTIIDIAYERDERNTA